MKGIRFTCLMLAACCLIAFSGCMQVNDVRVIKLGHGLGVTHSVHLAMEYMGERLEEKSGGRMRIDIYPSGQLGSERETMELLQIGSLDMTKVSASLLEAFVPEFSVFGLPFLFADQDHLFRVLESDVGEELLMAGERFRIVGLTYYDAGSRSFYTKDRPVNTPSDLRGLKIRTQESPTAIRMVRTLGGAPTPISWGELYTALQQGVVDGAENNPPSFYLSRHYEVCRYYTINEHTMVPDVVLVSTTFWNSLTEEEQQWVSEAARESFEHQKVLWQQSSDEALRAVEAAGVEVIYPDKEPFRTGVEPMYDDLRRTNPALYSLVERVREFE